MRLVVAGADTLVTSPMCAACAYSPAGCCAAPPRVALSDIARIVVHGGRDFVLAEIAAGRLVPAPGERWLVLPRRPHVTGVLACGYLGPTGCVLEPDRRAATCNYYACEEALAAGGADGERARAELDPLVARLARWDAELEALVDHAWPRGHTFDAPFLDWLAARYRELRP